MKSMHENRDTRLAGLRRWIISGAALALLPASALAATNASLSPASLDLAAGETGTVLLSGNDGSRYRTFQWSYPSGLTVTKGSYSNLSSFSISTSSRTIKVVTRGRGSFSANMKFSSSSAGASYTVSNTRADISLNPSDITVNIAGSGGTSGGTSGGGTSGGGTSGGGMDGGGMGGGGVAGGGIPVLDAGNVTLVVRQINRTMSDGQNVNFWVFCQDGGGGGGGGGGGAGCQLPGPTLELGVGQLANITLNMMMAPQEMPPYQGHTIHPHGVDVPQSEDGVPETGASVLGDTYNFSVDNRYVGSHMYHCHVHTVKHLEMGMYGALVVKSGNRINNNGPTYDYEWNWVMSTVDPAYHTAVQDSPVFADYNPRYFLVNGNEGRSKTSPAETFTAAGGTRVAIRLIGIHSVNSTFRVRNASGSAQQFTVYNVDGFALPAPLNVTSVQVSPGQTKDVMVTLPTGTGTWYPEVTYGDLRTNKTYSNGRVYTQLNF